MTQPQTCLSTPYGPVPYTLTRKKIKNLNLRVRTDGSVSVSAPLRMSQRQIDTFLQQKAEWVGRTRQQMLARGAPAPAAHSKEECLALFSRISDEIFPMFSDVLGGVRPTLRVREMKTRWGVCYPARRSITLNTRLADQPFAAIEYVILHEYVHFLHADHQAGFHAEMARLMPDYKQRRKLLRRGN